MMRSHTCGELRPTHVGQRVHSARLGGHGARPRRHHLIDLRDRYGVTQAIFDPKDSREAWDIAQGTRGEFVLAIEGVVRARPAEMVNTVLATGGIELQADNIKVLNRSKPVRSRWTTRRRTRFRKTCA